MAVATDIDLGGDLNVLPSCCSKKRLEGDRASTIASHGLSDRAWNAKP
jgi:hypothetical protein